MPYDAAIPELWHAAFLKALRNKHVYAARANRDYEGEIKGPGDVVRINTYSDVTIRTYTKNTTTITAAEKLNVGDLTLVIDQAFYANADVDDVDQVQMKPKARQAITESIGFGFAENMDDNLATVLNTDGDGFGTAATGNRTANTTIVATDENAYTILVDLSVLLDEDNVPEEGRWVVVPPWFRGSMVKDPRFVEYGTPANVRVLRDGPPAIYKAAGFDVFVSNNVPSTATTLASVIAGHPMALTVADQIPFGSLEFYRPEGRFSDAVKVLHVFGRKVVRSQALAMCLAENG